MKKKPKILSLEEKMIWQNYTKTIAKRVKTNSNLDDKHAVSTKNKINFKEVRIISEPKLNSLAQASSYLSGNSSSLDKKIHLKLKTGRINPEKFLDLHGLKYEQARSSVIDFISISYKKNLRLILIITGKGKKLNLTENYVDNDNSGVLKQAFPSWVESHQIKHLILNVTTAHSSHGGEGAYYVYLRKTRHYKT